LEGDNIAADVLGRVIEKLVDLDNGATNVEVKARGEYNRTVFITPGPTLEIAYTPSPRSFENEAGGQNLPYVQVSMRNYCVGYRQASYVIRRQIAPVLEAIASVIQTVESKYTLVVDFGKQQNPFFGLYIAQLPREAVSNFFIRIAAKNYGPNDTVLVSQSKIAINTHTQNALQNLALEFLAFRSDLQEQLESA